MSYVAKLPRVRITGDVPSVPHVQYYFSGITTDSTIRQEIAVFAAATKITFHDSGSSKILAFLTSQGTIWIVVKVEVRRQTRGKEALRIKFAKCNECIYFLKGLSIF